MTRFFILLRNLRRLPARNVTILDKRVNEKGVRRHMTTNLTFNNRPVNHSNGTRRHTNNGLKIKIRHRLMLSSINILTLFTNSTTIRRATPIKSTTIITNRLLNKSRVRHNIVVNGVVKRNSSLPLSTNNINPLHNRRRTLTSILLPNNRHKPLANTRDFRNNIRKSNMLTNVRRTIGTTSNIKIPLTSPTTPRNMTVPLQRRQLNMRTVRKRRTKIPTRKSRDHLTNHLNNNVRDDRINKSININIGTIRRTRVNHRHQNLRQRINNTTATSGRRISLIHPHLRVDNEDRRHINRRNFRHEKITTNRRHHGFRVQILPSDTFRPTSRVTVTMGARAGYRYWTRLLCVIVADMTYRVRQYGTPLCQVH